MDRNKVVEDWRASLLLDEHRKLFDMMTAEQKQVVRFAVFYHPDTPGNAQQQVQADSSSTPNSLTKCSTDVLAV